MRRNTIFVLCLLCSTLSSALDSEKYQREKKLFSVFNVVTFPNDQCTAKSDQTMKGTCYSSSECNSYGGTVDGNCAAGFGVCCTFTRNTCGSTVSRNCTYITNPSYPTKYTTAGSCAFSILPVNKDICQIRFDFTNFDIPVTNAGVCTDSFAVDSPSGRDPSTLCGTLTNQHLYVENGRSTASTTAKFTIASGGTWKIKVSQIECSSLNKAPTDCQQYFTGSSGNVISYGWYGAQNLQSVEFAHCIRRERGYCGVQYAEATGTTTDPFDLDDKINAISMAPVSLNGQNDIASEAMLKGYISIPGAPYVTMFSGGVFADQAIAGQASPGAVTTTGHTFTIDQVALAATQLNMEGFNLMYSQLPCSTSY